VGRLLVDAGHAAVDEVQQRRDEQRDRRRVGLPEPVKRGGAGAENDREQRDLVRCQAQPGEDPGKRVDAVDQVIAVLGQVQAQPLRAKNSSRKYYLKVIRRGGPGF
jgi:hypothetical protein